MAATISRRATERQRKCAGAILTAVVYSTPVGNPTLWQWPGPPGYVGGRARANWQVGVGQAPGSSLMSQDEGGGSTISTGKSAIEGSKKGEPIHLTNNLVYIVPLNNGHSTQAPSGFIDTSITIGINAVAGDSLFRG